MQLLERVKGSLFGLAIGDALGAPIEFRPPGTFKPITGMTGGGTPALPLAAGPTIRPRPSASRAASSSAAASIHGTSSHAMYAGGRMAI